MGHTHAVDAGATMPRGRSLYGSLPEQLEQPRSFIRRLSDILAIRRRHSIATGTQLEVPAVSDPAVLAMVHRLPAGLIQVTALNFSARSVSGRFASEHLAPQSCNDALEEVESQIEESRSKTTGLAAAGPPRPLS